MCGCKKPKINGMDGKNFASAGIQVVSAGGSAVAVYKLKEWGLPKIKMYAEADAKKKKMYNLGINAVQALAAVATIAYGPKKYSGYLTPVAVGVGAEAVLKFILNIMADPATTVQVGNNQWQDGKSYRQLDENRKRAIEAMRRKRVNGPTYMRIDGKDNSAASVFGVDDSAAQLFGPAFMMSGCM